MRDIEIEYGRMIGYYGSEERVAIPEEARVIGNLAFYHRSHVRRVVLSRGVREIERGAFHGCSDLESLYIPATVREIGPQPVSECPRFTAFEVSEDNIYFKAVDGILYNKEGSVLLACPTGYQGCVLVPDDVKVIAQQAFAGCKGVLQVSLPPGLQEIGGLAFWGSGLRSVRIPKGVMRIGLQAFKRCVHLERFWADPRNPVYGSKDGLLYLKKRKSLLWCPEGKAGAVTVAEGAVEIGDDAFGGCGLMTEVHLPDSLLRIGWSAFFECVGLTSIEIPKNVQLVGDYPFMGCVELRSIVNHGRPLLTGKGPRGMEELEIEAGFLPGEDLAALDAKGKLTAVRVYLRSRARYAPEEQALYDTYIKRQNGRLLKIFAEGQSAELVRALLDTGLVTYGSIDKALDAAEGHPEILALLLDCQSRHTDREKAQKRRMRQLMQGLE